LTAADASGHWNERLQGLRGQILVNRGQTALGRGIVNKAIAALRRDKAPRWMLARLQVSAAPAKKHS
jgi:hypothetical protein